MGSKLKKIHRGISFTEEAWLKPHIELNTQLRTKASDDFEKDFFKPMNKSLFGKTTENIHHRIDVRLRTNEKSAEKLVSKPNCEHMTIFDENLVAVHMKKTEFVYSKPVYLGILDISKSLMYDFHYNFKKKKFDCKLLMTDTDSLMYEVSTSDYYQDIEDDISEKFDTSNFPKTFDMPRLNTKMFGMFKDECGGQIISDFCRL